MRAEWNDDKLKLLSKALIFLSSYKHVIESKRTRFRHLPTYYTFFRLA